MLTKVQVGHGYHPLSATREACCIGSYGSDLHVTCRRRAFYLSLLLRYRFHPYRFAELLSQQPTTDMRRAGRSRPASAPGRRRSGASGEERSEAALTCLRKTYDTLEWLRRSLLHGASVR